MNIAHVLSWIDGAVLLVIFLCAIDGSRQVSWRQEPLRAFTFYVAGIGTLGYVCYRQFVSIEEVTWTLISHVGFMMYAINHLIKRYAGRRISDGKYSQEHFHRNLQRGFRSFTHRH